MLTFKFSSQDAKDPALYWSEPKTGFIKLVIDEQQQHLETIAYARFYSMSNEIIWLRLCGRELKDFSEVSNMHLIIKNKEMLRAALQRITAQAFTNRSLRHKLDKIYLRVHVVYNFYFHWLPNFYVPLSKPSSPFKLQLEVHLILNLRPSKAALPWVCFPLI